MTGPIKKEVLSSNSLNVFYGPSVINEPLISTNDLIDNDFILHSANLNFQNKKNRNFNLSKAFYGFTLVESFETSKDQNALNNNHLANLTYYDTDKISQATYVRIPYIHNLPDPEQFDSDAAKNDLIRSHSLCFLDPTVMDQTTKIPANTIVKVVFTDENLSFGYIISDPITFGQSLIGRVIAPTPGTTPSDSSETSSDSTEAEGTPTPVITPGDRTIDGNQIAFIKAHNYTERDTNKVAIVIHTTEGMHGSASSRAERINFANGRCANRCSGTARSIAEYFQQEIQNHDNDGRQIRASAHYVVDKLEVIQCVKEQDSAWHAKDNSCGFSSVSIGIEVVGSAYYNDQTWSNEYSKKQLLLLAKLCSQICKNYSIPVVHRTDANIDKDAMCRNPESFPKGFYGHTDVTKGFKVSGGHFDPGPNFPWNYFLQLVSEELAKLP